ncbi:MAG: hypothetical protein RJQ14_16240 [Marinoscillum sp.]
MKLLLTKGWTGEQELISDNPTEQEISKLLNSLDWQDFNSVQLQQDSKNFLDVSGNLNPDGLSILFEEHGTQYVSDEAPESIAQLEKTLTLYLKGDKRFKNFGFSSEDTSAKPPPNKETAYDLWKIQFEAKQKIDKRNRRIGFVAAILITGLIGSILYLWFTDELKFVRHDTDHIIATVTEVKLKFGFKGQQYQQVKYEFDYQGEHYQGFFRGNSITGYHRKNDRVKIKFATDDPKISKRVATMKRNTKHNKR